MSNAEKNAVKITVPSKDPKKKDDLDPKFPPKVLKDDNKGPIEEVKISNYILFNVFMLV